LGNITPRGEKKSYGYHYNNGINEKRTLKKRKKGEASVVGGAMGNGMQASQKLDAKKKAAVQASSI